MLDIGKEWWILIKSDYKMCRGYSITTERNLTEKPLAERNLENNLKTAEYPNSPPNTLVVSVCFRNILFAI